MTLGEVWFQVPPPGKGSMYIRPLLMGSGPVLGLAPSPEYTFLIYVSPVGNYFKVRYLLCFIERHRLYFLLYKFPISLSSFGCK